MIGELLWAHPEWWCVALSVAGYLAPWLAGGAVAAWLREVTAARADATASLAFALAALWVLAPPRARALVACHRTVPLSPGGWRADYDCLRFGGAIGSACVV